MSERKILIITISAIFYCLYSVHMWFVTNNVNEELSSNTKYVKPEIKPDKPQIVKSKTIPLYFKNACSILEVFIQEPNQFVRRNFSGMDLENNALAVIGITAFLFILVLNALFDVVKTKEMERAKRMFNPEGELRQSLAEFANKKMLRRASSKFGAQLFQISESEETSNDETKSPRESRPYTRAESINSYLGEKRNTKSSAPESINESFYDRDIFKRQSISNLLDCGYIKQQCELRSESDKKYIVNEPYSYTIVSLSTSDLHCNWDSQNLSQFLLNVTAALKTSKGGRPTPMLRRSSFPTLPLNPGIQALMNDTRQQSFESDDESEKKRRRVRILRRF